MVLAVILKLRPEHPAALVSASQDTAWENAGIRLFNDGRTGSFLRYQMIVSFFIVISAKAHRRQVQVLSNPGIMVRNQSLACYLEGENHHVFRVERKMITGMPIETTTTEESPSVSRIKSDFDP